MYCKFNLILKPRLPIARIFRRGFVGPSAGGGCRGGASSENLPLFESLRMALVITLHHKYVQLSSSNHTIPICSRKGMVMVLEFNYSHMQTCEFLKHVIHVALWTAAAAKLL